MLDSLMNKVRLFGLYFASLDIRQDSSVHGKVLEQLSEAGLGLPKGFSGMSASDQEACLSALDKGLPEEVSVDGMAGETIASIRAIRRIQALNGEAGAGRYIISQCNSSRHLMEVMALFVLAGWDRQSITVDIVPLFETIDDLLRAERIMEELYSLPVYREHLKRRGDRQTIMLGFSDGTKDGGYLMANFSIYKAKESLTSISRQFGIEVVFFDGRGGPPARGGGKTHKFYASLGRNIANREIQLTVQGQTVSSNFGTVDAAQFNIEQLLHAGLSNDLVSAHPVTMDSADQCLLEELSVIGHEAYVQLREHPHFLDYLGHASPLRFYAETNIGSRPAKRGAAGRLNLKDLMAIPFVGAWSQLKQNVTGYYGVGTALRRMDEAGKLPDVKVLYHRSAFFKTLIDNCEMAMLKCHFPLTRFLSDHPVYGVIWHMIHEEFELTRRYIFQLSGKTELMADYPVEQLSVQMRERIVLPLTTIQQFAITKVRELEEHMMQSPDKKVYEKLVMRCSFGIINAGRNSA
jgi:phosphoenolpyruvate carboxylase